jgi:hypothetical protein
LEIGSWFQFARAKSFQACAQPPPKADFAALRLFCVVTAFQTWRTIVGSFPLRAAHSQKTYLPYS